MSKMDGLRAMREAGHEQAMARRAAAQTGSQPPIKNTAAKPAAKSGAAKPATAPAPVSADGACGHRSMNGRTCTREQGHAAKSHRYS